MRGRLSYKGGSYENVTLLTLETMAGTIEADCLNTRVLKPRLKLEKAECLVQQLKYVITLWIKKQKVVDFILNYKYCYIERSPWHVSRSYCICIFFT